MILVRVDLEKSIRSVARRSSDQKENLRRLSFLAGSLVGKL